MQFLKQPFVLVFLFSAINHCQIDSNKVSNPKLKSDLRNSAKIEIIEFTAPAQQPHKQGRIFLDTL